MVLLNRWPCSWVGLECKVLVSALCHSHMPFRILDHSSSLCLTITLHEQPGFTMTLLAPSAYYLICLKHISATVLSPVWLFFSLWPSQEQKCYVWGRMAKETQEWRRRATGLIRGNNVQRGKGHPWRSIKENSWEFSVLSSTTQPKSRSCPSHTVKLNWFREKMGK